MSLQFTTKWHSKVLLYLKVQNPYPKHQQLMIYSGLVPAHIRGSRRARKVEMAHFRIYWKLSSVWIFMSWSTVHFCTCMSILWWLTYKIFSFKLFWFFLIILLQHLTFRCIVFMQSLAFSRVKAAGASTWTSTMVSSSVICVFSAISALWTPAISLFSSQMPLNSKF